VDYEGEIGVVISEECSNVSAESAESVILGYTCFNDVSDRDNQFNEQNWVRGKGFDTSAPIGPVILTQGEVEGALTITTRVNGEVKQNSDSSYLIFTIPELIEEISSIMTLEEGDVIATGTPAGVGPLSPGDVVKIEIDGVGVLENPVV
jgi:2-keto-4-pentenoate hydratase/2-oxohepta-3-ene-1,7-dioic acid hydratase in catechol pathway